ncbi:phage portal protein [Pseudorhodobacter sp. MZDSW-24AT]|uniref:phage portal protein n=1 Tax=Pseudorhodobacter sp. MZDSW-24AT TaxID=2052957 RepID=UPI000C1E16E3|nr:phage portal protein [Pseudorhodobacter sp. MZDSW-24AT]PJF10780.1 phage portal protein [Pseudorhodobacter sp. MZDSW-24AT]
MFQSVVERFKYTFGPKPEAKSFTLTDPEAFQLFGITGTGAGVSIGPRSAMKVPAVACAVSLIAETAGSLPAKVYDRDTRENVKDHPAYTLIHDEANPWTSAEALRVQITTDALLHGHGFAFVVRNDAGAPLELHRLEPTAVQVDTLADGEPSYIVAFDDAKRTVPFQDILHLSAFGGIAPIKLGHEAIGLALSFEAHIAKLFANGGKPGGILKSEKALGDEAKTKLAASWTAAHGAGRSGGTAILDEGMSFETVTMTLTDAQFAENRLEQIREIARVFRVPPTMLFELTRGTWSNTEEMARQFLQVTLKPWLSSWAWAYARCLLTPEERKRLYIEFVTDDLLTTTAAARATAYGQYRAMGAMTANEVRSGLNLPPMADGNALQNPFTTTSATPAPSQEEPQDD